MLRLAGLTYRIGGRVLLDDASATIGAGERVGFVGRNLRIFFKSFLGIVAKSFSTDALK